MPGAERPGVTSPPQFDRALMLLGRLNESWAEIETLLVPMVFGEASAVPDDVQALALSVRIGRLSALRDHYNRCMGSFDPMRGNGGAVLGRIGTRAPGLAGKRAPDTGAAAAATDDAALRRIARTLEDVRRLNRDLRAARAAAAGLG